MSDTTLRLRPWEGLAEGEWWASTPRQLTGAPYRYHGYVTRDRKKQGERLCHDGYHRTPEAATSCAERTARRLNEAIHV